MELKGLQKHPRTPGVTVSGYISTSLSNSPVLTSANKIAHEDYDSPPVM